MMGLKAGGLDHPAPAQEGLFGFVGSGPQQGAEHLAVVDLVARRGNRQAFLETWQAHHFREKERECRGAALPCLAVHDKFMFACNSGLLRSWMLMRTLRRQGAS